MQALLICKDADEAAILSLVLQRASLISSRVHEIPTPLATQGSILPDLIILTTTSEEIVLKVKRIRAQTLAPLIVITESISEAAYVAALESGADLIVEKPYSARLLIAQIRSLLKRTAHFPSFTLPTLSLRDIVLNPATRTVTVGTSSPKRLTQLEFRLLYVLMLNRDQVIPTDALVEQVWEYNSAGERDLVRGLVRRLRAKIEPDPGHPRYIVTVPGIGYTFPSDS